MQVIVPFETVIPRAARQLFRIERMILRRGGAAVASVMTKADPPSRISFTAQMTATPRLEG